MKEQQQLAERQFLTMTLNKVKPLKPPPPPAVASSQDVARMEEEQRRVALKRTNSARNTLFAGETGGYKGGELGGAKTLLG